MDSDFLLKQRVHDVIKKHIKILNNFVQRSIQLQSFTTVTRTFNAYLFPLLLCRRKKKTLPTTQWQGLSIHICFRCCFVEKVLIVLYYVIQGLKYWTNGVWLQNWQYQTYPKGYIRNLSNISLILYVHTWVLLDTIFVTDIGIS